MKEKGIYQDNNKKYYISIKLKDGDGYKTITRRGYKTRTEAIAAKYKLINEQEEIIAKKKFKTPTIKDAVDDWAENKISKIRKSSYLQKEMIINKYILPVFGDIETSKLTYEDIKKWKATSFENISTGHINKIILTFRDIIERAYRSGNISQEVYGKCYLALESQADKSQIVKEKNYWTKDEFYQFLNTFERDSKWYPFFFTLYYTGMRFGEISGLQWKNFDEINGTLKVDHQASNKQAMGKWVLVPPKTAKSNREILLTQENKELLLEMKNALNPKKDDFIFFGANPTSQTNTTKTKNAHIKQAGVKKITLHEFRHSHASLLINNGADIILVSNRLGHASISETLDTYTHLFPNKQVEIISKI